jgi:hypothetical protein
VRKTANDKPARDRHRTNTERTTNPHETDTEQTHLARNGLEFDGLAFGEFNDHDGSTVWIVLVVNGFHTLDVLRVLSTTTCTTKRG